MKQQSEAIAAHQMIEMIEEPKKEAKMKNNCYVKAAAMLGVIQIICGFIALGIFINGIVFHNGSFFSFDNSILIFILFFVSGMLVLGKAYSGKKWLASVLHSPEGRCPSNTQEVCLKRTPTNLRIIQPTRRILDWWKTARNVYPNNYRTYHLIK